MQAKKSNKQNNRVIKPINYLYALLILIGGIVAVLLIFKWYQVKNAEKLMESYLVKTSTINNVISLDDYDHIKQEVPNYFLYISYTGNEEVYDLEKNLKVVIDDYNLNDMFYYIDMTKEKENNKKFLEKIKTALGTKDIEQIPAIIYVTNGSIKKGNILDGVKNTLVKVDDLEQLLEIYEYEKVE